MRPDSSDELVVLLDATFAFVVSFEAHEKSRGSNEIADIWKAERAFGEAAIAWVKWRRVNLPAGGAP